MPIKIVHFADVHLGMENYGKIDPNTGLNSRLKDFTDAFDQIISFVKDHDIDLVVFAGDAYKTRDPSPTFQREFAKRIFKFSKLNVPIVMVVGNHDFPNALGKADTLDIFPTLSVPNIYSFKKEDLINIETKSGQIQVAGLPWFTRSQLLSKTELMQKSSEALIKLATEKLAEKVSLISAKIDPSIPSILVAHATVENSVYGAERQIMIGSDIVIPLKVLRNSRFNAVFLGHLHQHQEIIANPPTVYSGSIERVDFGEENQQKGFIYSEISHFNNKFKASLEFIKLKTRPFCTIRVKITNYDDDPTAKIISEIKKRNICDAVIKIIVCTPEDKADQIRESEILGVTKSANFIAGIVKEIQRGDRTKTENGFSDELANLDTLGLLEKYLKTKKFSALRIQTLKNEVVKLLDESL